MDESNKTSNAAGRSKRAALAALDAECQNQLDHLLKKVIGRIRSSREVRPITASADTRLLDSIRVEEAPVEGSGFDELEKELLGRILPLSVKTSHPLFLGYVTPPSLEIAAAADYISALLNQNASFADLSPIGAVLEEAAINWISQLVGMPQMKAGILTSGGSAANLQALVIARTKQLEGREVHPDRFRIYCSEQTHRSIHKAASILGLPTKAVVTVRTSEKTHQMDPDDLEKQLLRDKRLERLAVIGAAGTRLCGAVDDLRALGNITHNHGLWFHVDAAFAGVLRQASGSPTELRGLDLADSVTVDPHKLLFAPFPVGALLVADRAAQYQAFGHEGEYLEKSAVCATDFADFGPSLGRPMAALKIWLAVKRYGLNGFIEEYERLLDLNRQFRHKVNREDDFELLGPGPTIVSCFRWIGNGRESPAFLETMNRGLAQMVRQQGAAYINQVQVASISGTRVSFSNFRTQADHVDSLLTICRNAIDEIQSSR